MDSEKLYVKFGAHMGDRNNCICDACHNTGTVMKLKLPYTRYYDGKKLSTMHQEYWLCGRCRRNLRLTMDWPYDAYQQGFKDMIGTTITNAGRIRSMSDNELADFIVKLSQRTFVEDVIITEQNCLEWLQRPAE